MVGQVVGKEEARAAWSIEEEENLNLTVAGLKAKLCSQLVAVVEAAGLTSLGKA
jgi:hypothetical protein